MCPASEVTCVVLTCSGQASFLHQRMKETETIHLHFLKHFCQKILDHLLQGTLCGRWRQHYDPPSPGQTCLWALVHPRWGSQRGWSAIKAQRHKHTHRCHPPGTFWLSGVPHLGPFGQNTGPTFTLSWTFSDYTSIQPNSGRAEKKKAMGLCLHDASVTSRSRLPFGIWRPRVLAATASTVRKSVSPSSC